MTAAAARNDAPSLRRLARAGRLLGMPLLFAAAMAATVAIHPDFGSFEIQSLALGALPLALAAAAQAIVIISGGIDLSIGSMIAVSNVLSASLMQHATFGQSLALSLLVLAAGAAQGLLNGLVVAVSRIPDVVATLTTGFIWGGVALLILERPGRGRAGRLPQHRRRRRFRAMGAERAGGDGRRRRRDLAADQAQPHRTSDLRRRQRSGRRVSQRRQRHESAHDRLYVQRNRLRGRGHGAHHDDGDRRAAGWRLLHAEQRRRRRHRRRQPRGRARREWRGRSSPRFC